MNDASRFLCDAPCRSNGLGRAECRHVRHDFGFDGDDRVDFYLCRRTGLEFTEAPVSQKRLEQGTAEVSGDLDQLVRTYGDWIKISDEKGRLYPHLRYDSQALVDALYARVLAVLRWRFPGGFPRPFRILEVGCGSGFLLAALRDRHPEFKVQGLDISPLNCKHAREFYGVEAHCGTLGTLTFEPAGFDAVLILGNLMLHTNPLATLEAAQRLIAPGGVLFFEVKNPQTSIRRLMRLLLQVASRGLPRRVRNLVQHTFHGMRFGMSQRWLRGVLPAIGLAPIRMRTLPPRLLSVSNRHPYAVGLSRLAWSFFNTVDAVRGQRAWIEVVCTPAPAGT